MDGSPHKEIWEEGEDGIVTLASICSFYSFLKNQVIYGDHDVFFLISKVISRVHVCWMCKNIKVSNRYCRIFLSTGNVVILTSDYYIYTERTNDLE